MLHGRGDVRLQKELRVDDQLTLIWGDYLIIQLDLHMGEEGSRVNVRMMQCEKDLTGHC